MRRRRDSPWPTRRRGSPWLTRPGVASSLCLLACVPIAAAIGLEEPHSCTLVTITHTNLDLREAASILQLYMEVTEVTGTLPEPISKRLQKERGGFWDVYFLGSSFSYSVRCLEYVEAAGAEWNVLMCRESVDEEAYSCGPKGPNGLALYHNGTLSRDEFAPQRLAVRATPTMYANYLVKDKAVTEAARMPSVVAALQRLTAEELLRPTAADELRTALEARLPNALWNVLIERAAGGHYYYSEEQFNLDVQLESEEPAHPAPHPPLQVAVFDRRCDTLQREQRGEPNLATWVRSRATQHWKK